MYGGFAPGKSDDLLFNKADIRDVIDHQNQLVKKEVEGQDEQYILSVVPEDYTAYLFDKFKINLPELAEPALEEHPTKLDVSRDPLRVMMRDRSGPFFVDAQEIRVCVPFEGDSEMFKIRPVTFTLNPPRGNVKAAELQFSVISERIDPENAKKEIEQRLKEIKSALATLKPSVDDFNDRLKGTILALLKRRKDNILQRKQMASSIGIPLRQRDENKTYTIPTVRKKLPIQKPLAERVQFKPEPAIEMDTYEHIIEVICKVARMMEFSPHMFKNLGEEDLRTHFLFQLNGHYDGGVSGETFNGEGKTDILIRAEGGGNVFVAECKYWHGEKHFIATIDQLLGYVTWRDTKTSILVFCKNKNCAAVQEQLAPLVRKHPNYKRDADFQSEMGSRFVMKNKNDPGKELLLTVLFFCVPCDEDPAK